MLFYSTILTAATASVNAAEAMPIIYDLAAAHLADEEAKRVQLRMQESLTKVRRV